MIYLLYATIILAWGMQCWVSQTINKQLNIWNIRWFSVPYSQRPPEVQL